MSYLYDMSQPTYTLKEIASLLSAAGDPESVEKLSRQIRHWTSLDLLSPIGKKHTGTGVSRRYELHEVHKAAILTELSRYRVPVTVLDEAFVTMIANHADSPDWAKAVKGDKPVYLMFGFSDDVIVNQLFVEGAKHPLLEPKFPEAMPGAPIVSAITINLSALFKRLNR